MVVVMTNANTKPSSVTGQVERPTFAGRHEVAQFSNAPPLTASAIEIVASYTRQLPPSWRSQFQNAVRNRLAGLRHVGDFDTHEACRRIRQRMDNGR